MADIVSVIVPEEFSLFYTAQIKSLEEPSPYKALAGLRLDRNLYV